MLAPTCSAAHKGEPGEQKRFVCVPGQDAAVYWHPYKLVDEPRMNGRLSCPLVQRRLADLGHSIPEMLPAPTAQLLHVVTLAGERVHEISPATIPSIGLTLERRAMLARDVRGGPWLWIRRQRISLPRAARKTAALRHDGGGFDRGCGATLATAGARNVTTSRLSVRIPIPLSGERLPYSV